MLCATVVKGDVTLRSALSWSGSMQYHVIFLVVSPKATSYYDFTKELIQLKTKGFYFDEFRVLYDLMKNSEGSKKGNADPVFAHYFRPKSRLTTHDPDERAKILNAYVLDVFRNFYSYPSHLQRKVLEFFDLIYAGYRTASVSLYDVSNTIRAKDTLDTGAKPPNPSPSASSLVVQSLLPSWHPSSGGINTTKRNIVDLLETCSLIDARNMKEYKDVQMRLQKRKKMQEDASDDTSSIKNSGSVSEIKLDSPKNRGGNGILESLDNSIIEKVDIEAGLELGNRSGTSSKGGSTTASGHNTATINDSVGGADDAENSNSNNITSDNSNGSNKTANNRSATSAATDDLIKNVEYDCITDVAFVLNKVVSQMKGLSEFLKEYVQLQKESDRNARGKELEMTQLLDKYRHENVKNKHILDFFNQFESKGGKMIVSGFILDDNAGDYRLGDRGEKDDDDDDDEDDEEHLDEKRKRAKKNERKFADGFKVNQMQNMIEDVTVNINGTDIQKKVLYLTNRQVRLIVCDKENKELAEENMQKCIKYLDLGEPKLIISLLPSLGIRSQMKTAHSELFGNHQEFDGFSAASSFVSSEISSKDERVVETQVLLFMKTVLIPLACKTNAVIVVGGANDCYLSACLANLAIIEEHKWNNNCPFKVVATAYEYEVHSKVVKSSGIPFHEADKLSIAYQLSTKSASWLRRIKILDKEYAPKSNTNDDNISASEEEEEEEDDEDEDEEEEEVEEEENNINVTDGGESTLFSSEDFNPDQRCDLNPAASRYIIVESIEFGKDKKMDENEPKNQFDNLFLQTITRGLPAFCIQAFNIGDMKDIFLYPMEDKIPVLLLDSSERAFTMTGVLSEAAASMDLSRESDCFPWISSERLQKITLENGFISMEGRQEILHIAEEMACRIWETRIKHGTTDSLTASTIAFFHSAIRLGSGNILSKNQASMSLCEKIDFEEQFRSKIKIENDLRKQAILFLFLIDRKFALQSRKIKIEKWLKDNQSKMPNDAKLIMQARALVSQIELSIDTVSSYPTKALERRATKMMEGEEKIADDDDGGFDVENLEERYNESFDPVHFEEFYRDYSTLFKNKFIYSGSLHDITSVKHTLDKIAKVDRLQEDESNIDTLNMIKNAWDLVEIYHVIADYYKVFGMICYFIMLSSGVAFTALSLAETETSLEGLLFNPELPIFIVSGLSTLTMIYVALCKPLDSWELYRKSALQLESVIWRFRCRAGEFTESSDGKDTAAEDALVENIKSITEIVSGKKGIKASWWFTYLYLIRLFIFCFNNSFLNRHEQHKSNKTIFREEKANRKGNSEATPVDPTAAGTNTAGDDDSADSVNAKRKLARSQSIASMKTMSTTDDSNSSLKTLANLIPHHKKRFEKSDVNNNNNYNNNNNNNNNNNRKDSRPLEPFSVRFDEITRILVRDNDNDTQLVKDNHYSPLEVHMYIRFRLEESLLLFKKKVPFYDFFLKLSQAFIVILSIASGALSYFGVGLWVPGVSILSASITGYLSFRGTASKLDRYSDTIDALQKLLMWWQTLAPIEKNSGGNIDKLIQTGEDILMMAQMNTASGVKYQLDPDTFLRTDAEKMFIKVTS